MSFANTPSAATGSESVCRSHFVIQRTTGWSAIDFRELWRYRDLLLILVERDVKLRYKQTALGIVWVVLQPLVASLIFAIIFGRFAKLPSDGIPYLPFVFCGLVPWNYFAGALQRSSNSLVTNSQLVSKVYFPRLLIPLAHTLAVLVDFLVMFAVLLALLAIYRIVPTWRVLTLPFFLILATMTGTGVSLWFSALSVRYRDFMYALPFLIQVWMYASPIVYASSIIPDKWRLLYSLNPVVGYIEGFRWSLLSQSALTTDMLIATIVLSIVACLSGAFFFRNIERSFADVI